MKERLILFSAPMIRALLDGRKTMTRRVVKPQPDGHRRWTKLADAAWWTASPGEDWQSSVDVRCPFGDPGDRLWVRETFAYAGPRGERDGQVVYRADLSDDEVRDSNLAPSLAREYGSQWRPAIHMPRWASRLTLAITAVRVERVQEITDEDAVREGVVEDRGPGETWYEGKAKGIFARLWDTIHGPGAWDRNDWVWVVEFKVVAQ